VEARRDAAILRASLESLTEARLRPVQHGRDRRPRPRGQARALYRRWPSKAARVVDAVSAWREEVAWLSISDTRSLQGHIEAPIANVPDLDEADISRGPSSSAWRPRPAAIPSEKTALLDAWVPAIVRGPVGFIELLPGRCCQVRPLVFVVAGIPGRLIAVVGAYRCARAMERVRVDKWLWAARFFKTRSAATEAVIGGRVNVNGSRAKAAKEVTTGDTVEVTIQAQKRAVQVAGLSDKRGPAAAASMLYAETPESMRARRQDALERRLVKPVGADLGERPSKRDRRRLEALRRADQHRRLR
jgi:ribosome-associated heat shock protein Hsp15